MNSGTGKVHVSGYLGTFTREMPTSREYLNVESPVSFYRMYRLSIKADSAADTVSNRFSLWYSSMMTVQYLQVGSHAVDV